MARARGTATADPPASESIPDLIREAIADATDWLKAEVALVRAQASDAAHKYATAASACLLAAVLALMAVSYLLYAAMLSLRPHLGEIGAALAIAGALLIAAIALGLYGRSRFNKARIVPARIAQALTKDDAGKDSP